MHFLNLVDIAVQNTPFLLNKKPSNLWEILLLKLLQWTLGHWLFVVHTQLEKRRFSSVRILSIIIVSIHACKCFSFLLRPNTQKTVCINLKWVNYMHLQCSLIELFLLFFCIIYAEVIVSTSNKVCFHVKISNYYYTIKPKYDSSHISENGESLETLICRS